VRALLEGDSREPAAWTAPPSGLFLERVLYPGDRPPEGREPAFPVGR
jgi:tRNA U38,U39,U40 pseudouridine synthase TruA